MPENLSTDSGTTTQTEAATTHGGQEAVTPAAVDAQAAQAADTKPNGKDGKDGDMFPRSYVEELRGESANYRTRAAEIKAELDAAAAERDQVQQQLQSVLAALGMGEQDDTSDPAKLLEKVTAERDSTAAELRHLRVNDAVQKACVEAEADPTLTTAVLHSSGQLDSLDPSADDFASQVAALVADAVTGNPKLKAAPMVPAASGSDPQQSTTPKRETSGPEGWHQRLYGK